MSDETDALWGQLGMMLRYPLLYEGAKLLGQRTGLNVLTWEDMEVTGTIMIETIQQHIRSASIVIADRLTDVIGIVTLIVLVKLLLDLSRPRDDGGSVGPRDLLPLAVTAVLGFVGLRLFEGPSVQEA